VLASAKIRRMTNPLQDARVDADLTMSQLAQRAGVALDTISRAEKGMTLSPLTQARIARALGRDRRELFPEPEEATA
jgi:transcriptional regulator with XRE-family HTH domain